MSTPQFAHTPEQSQLGKTVHYPQQYDPSVLLALPRAPQREQLHMGATLPFTGADYWTGYELSWLNPRGKPEIALLQLALDCNTPCIVESKSLKLYLNSFNNSRFDNAQAVRERIAQDLSATAWQGATSTPHSASVQVALILPQHFEQQRIAEFEGLNLDRLDIECSHYDAPKPELLRSQNNEPNVTETLYSHLLKSNCPVTNQPDWGSVQISYTGAAIDQAGLLQYIVSFRNHNEFHEHCAERMFVDIMQRCQPEKLSVYARYTRRGGLDINPFRTNHPQAMPKNIRNARQ